MEQALGNGGARCKKCDPAHVTELEIEVEKMETDGAVKGEGGEEGEGKPGEEGQGEAMQMG